MARSVSRVYDAKEFVRWFERQIKEEMKCHNVYVEYIEVSCDVIVVFNCGNKSFMAIITEGDKFRVSVYRIRRNRLIKLKCEKLCKKPIMLVRDNDFSSGVLILFYVADGVNIDVHEIPEVRIYL